MATLHVYLDESGDLKFKPTGSKYYVFAAAWTYDPAPLAADLTKLRFQLLKAGNDIPTFHATEDKQAHRDAVVQQLTARGDWNFGAIVVEKRKVNPSIREAKQFYPQFAAMMLRFVFKGFLHVGTTHV